MRKKFMEIYFIINSFFSLSHTMVKFEHKTVKRQCPCEKNVKTVYFRYL